MIDSRHPTDSLLARYLSGECTPEERLAVERWLREEPANQQELQQLAMAWSRAGEEPDADVDAFWQQVRNRIEVPAAPQVQGAAPTFSIGDSSRWSTPLKIAATILVVAGAGVAGRALLDAPAKPAAAPAFSVVSTTRGQRMSFRLPDGTLVALAPGTTLRTPSSYNARDRAVQLEGEAAFTVVHDSTRPFAVHTARLVARDLGTRFVVRSYADDPVTDVVVAEGLVAVARDSGSGPRAADSLVLSRGERARATPDGRLALTRNVPLDTYFGWTEGRVVFRDTPLREALPQLRRWLDVDVRLGSSGLGHLGFTGSFREDESAAEVLRLIATALRLDVVPADSGRYTLRAK